MKNFLLRMDKQIFFNLDNVSVCLYLGSVWKDVANTLLIQIKSITKIAIFCFGSSKFIVDAGGESHKPSAYDPQIRSLQPEHFSFQKVLSGIG
jgi:hypothetical protein